MSPELMVSSCFGSTRLGMPAARREAETAGVGRRREGEVHGEKN